MRHARRAGLYVIVNTKTGDRYVGSAQCFRVRWNEHLLGLRAGRHENARLQNAWNKYGEEAFEFRILAVLEPTQTLATEQRLVNLVFGKRCYNIRRDVSPAMYGKKMPESAKAKLSSDRKGRTFSPDHCAKISAAKKGKPGKKHTPETKARIAAANTGRVRSPEARERMSAAHAGRPLSERHRAGMSAARIGKQKSDAHRRALSESVSAEWAATKDRSRPTMRNPETREKIAAKKRAWWAAKKAAKQGAA